MIASVLCAALVAIGGAAQSEVRSMAPSDVERQMGAPFYSGAILPTPRQVDYSEGALPLIDGPGGQWRCGLQLPDDEGLCELMLRLLHRRVDPYLEQFPTVPGSPSAGEGPVLRFALGSELAASDLAEQIGRAAELGDLKPQGYILSITAQGGLCIGADRTGLLNGLASVLQLLRVEGETLAVACAQVVDWPTFRTRYTAEYHLPGEEFFDFMMLQKINGFGACYPGMRWSGLTEGHRKGLQGIGEYIRRYGTMHFMVQFHVGGRGGERPLDCGDPADVETLLTTIRQTLELTPTQHVMICYDDVVPKLQPEEERQFDRPAQAHGALMEQVYRAVKALSPETVVSFCSPYYQGRRHRRWREENPLLAETLQYMEDLKAWENRDIRLVWTGPVTESKVIVPEDITHYLGLVGEDRKLTYWDNTWHYHQPLRNFHSQYPEGFVDSCADETSYINVNGVRPIGRFFSVTANDYYWNPERFDTLHSRQHAVAQFMGPEAVPVAEEFYKLRGDNYFVFFTRDVNMAALKEVLDRLKATSLTPELPDQCLAVYEGMVKEREKAAQQ